jgi:putative transposase
MEIIREYRDKVPLYSLCKALGVPRSSAYRKLLNDIKERSTPSSPRGKSVRALSEAEEKKVLDTLHSDRFVDSSPAQVWATLLDENKYLCSVRTMYRILSKNEEVLERRRGHQKKNYPRPELLATSPNQVWSWDITKLHGPHKWNYFYLYVIMDIFSRYVLGWMVADKESGLLAKNLIEESCLKQEISHNQLTIHSDRGGPMKSKSVALLLADLGVMKSLSRPHVSNDNPFSESQFKTLKYCPKFPGRFGSIQDARSFCRHFFAWYNQEHKHSSLGYHIPEDVHYDRIEKVNEGRNRTLKLAYECHPERFVKKVPKAPEPPRKVWINKPKSENEDFIFEAGTLCPSKHEIKTVENKSKNIPKEDFKTH